MTTARARRTDIYYQNKIQIGGGRVRRVADGFEFFYRPHSVSPLLVGRRNWRLVVNDADIVTIHRFWRNRFMIVRFNGDDEIGVRADVLDDVPETVHLPIVDADASAFPEIRRMQRRFAAGRRS